MQNKIGFRSLLSSTLRISALTTFVLAALAAAPCRADNAQTSSDVQPTSSGNPVADYFINWFPRVTQIQSEQPHWITPLVTVTPRLEEEYRYDQSWDTKASHASIENFGTTKGLEFIPFDPVEVIVGVPGYEEQNRGPHQFGWADETFLLKYRILSGNEANGDYILTAFMGLSVPSGSDDFTSHNYEYTPTIAGGKGWGNFDIQSTLGFTAWGNGFVHKDDPGNAFASNTTFQYRIAKFFWPEVEANYTYWPSGQNEGRSQLLITPALMVGRIPISGRVGITFGLGCEFPVTDHATIHRNVIFSGRIPF